MSDTIITSWFITFNNPEEKGYTGTPEEICNRIVSEWVGESETRSCALLLTRSSMLVTHVWLP